MPVPLWAMEDGLPGAPGRDCRFSALWSGLGRTGGALAVQRWSASCSEQEVGRMAVRRIAHPSVDDRKAEGLAARDNASLSSHTKWTPAADRPRSEEHTSELKSHVNLVCRLLLENKRNKSNILDAGTLL